METRPPTETRKPYQLHLIPGMAPERRRHGRPRRPAVPGWRLDRATRRRGLVGVAEARRRLEAAQVPEDRLRLPEAS